MAYSIFTHRFQVVIFSSLLIILAALSHFWDIPCLIRTTTGVPCPTCGLTRAIYSLINLRFSESFYYHPLAVPIVFFLLIVLYMDISNLSTLSKKKFNLTLYIGSFTLFAVYLFRLSNNLIP